jgi:hypothetical protein
VLDGVSEQVLHHGLEQLSISSDQHFQLAGLGHQQIRYQLHFALLAEGLASLYGISDQLVDGHGLHCRDGKPRLGASQQQQAVDQPPESPHLLLNARHEPVVLLGRSRLLGEHLSFSEQDGDWRLQLVRGVGNEPLLSPK